MANSIPNLVNLTLGLTRTNPCIQQAKPSRGLEPRSSAFKFRLTLPLTDNGNYFSKIIKYIQIFSGFIFGATTTNYELILVIKNKLGNVA